MTQTTKKNKFLINSLSFKAAILLLALLFSFSLIICFFIRKENRKQGIVASEKLVIQAGGNTINRLLTEFAEIEALTESQAHAAEIIEAQPSIYKKNLSNNLANYNNKNVLGAGFWTAPNFSIGDINAVFWERNLFKMFEYNDSFESDESYMEKEWFNLAQYADKGRCVWDLPHRNKKTEKLEVLCAVASTKHDESLGVSANNDESLGVATINMDLSHLEILATKASLLTGGYVFFVDKEEKFITFRRGGEDGIPMITDERNNAANYVHFYDEYSLISDAIQIYDKSVIHRAKNRLGDEYENELHQLRRSSSNLSERTSAIDIASFYEEVEDSAYFATANLKNDPLFNAGGAKAYIFHVPKVYWTMVIVLSNKKVAADIDKLSNFTLLLLLVTTIFLSFVCYVLLEFRVFYPVRRAVISLRKMSVLLHDKQYSKLSEHKLEFVANDELGVMGKSINLLIARLVENEEALKNANELLEQRIIERTNELSETLLELKNSQTQLVQAEKMSLLGKMVAGVTHEVNTPLGYLKNNLLICESLAADYEEIFELLEKLNYALTNGKNNESSTLYLIEQTQRKIEKLSELEFREEIKELLQDALFGVEQISDLVVNLKDFARLDEAKVKSIDVHECIEGALKMFNIYHGSGIVTKNFAIRLPNICCMPSQVNQVLINLLNNSMEAIDKKEDKFIEVSTAIELDYIRISIKDNGIGVTEANQEKIFEPFFSTAPSGKGTGLGLAICKKIIEEHNGKITLFSDEGKGATFSVYFPLTKTTNIN